MNSLEILTIDLGTELGPAISLAYEEAEDDILDRPPRDIKKDRLMSFRLLSYSYLQAGVIETMFCFVAFFWVYLDYGLQIGELFFLSPTYFNANTKVNYVSLSEKVYSIEEQMVILKTGAAAYYVTLVMGQFFNIWMCKTRQRSFISHFFKNSITFYGVIIEVAIILMVVYIPDLQEIFETVYLDGKYWYCCLGTGITLIAFNEIRKYWTRMYPHGKVADYLMW